MDLTILLANFRKKFSTLDLSRLELKDECKEMLLLHLSRITVPQGVPIYPMSRITPLYPILNTVVLC